MKWTWRDSPVQILFKRPDPMFRLSVRSAPPAFVPLRYRPCGRLHSAFIGLIIYRVNISSLESGFPVALLISSLPEVLIKWLDLTSLMRSNHRWELPAVCSHDIVHTSIQNIDPQKHTYLFITLICATVCSVTTVLRGEFGPNWQLNS